MNTNQDPRRHDRERDDAIDELIRRRFQACQTMPLFPERLPPGFFSPNDIGRQLRLMDAQSAKSP